MVALLLNAEERDDMTAAIITANISPTIPVGRMFNTNLLGKNHISVWTQSNPLVKSHSWAPSYYMRRATGEGML